MKFQMHHSETFTNQLRDIPVHFWPQITEKAETLRTEPLPDGTIRKKLKKYKNPVYRIRSGNYRIVYTFGDGWVELLGVDDRDDVYDDEVYVGTSTGKLGEGDKLEERTFSFDEKREQPEVEYLPRVIDEESLQLWGIPEVFFPALVTCKTVQDLTGASVPDPVRDRIFDIVMDPNYDVVIAKPTFVTGETHNLIRYVEGELLGFLLKLDEEQEAMVDWGMKGSGPTLVKGGPGTGKSTVGLYRVRAIQNALKAAGQRRPRILFTTYTNALVNFSEQLLGHLLGDGNAGVEVKTADSVVTEVLTRLNLRMKVADDRLQRGLLISAMEKTNFGEGAARYTIEKLGLEYLLEEIGAVIEAREVESLEEYLAASRAGRRVPLNAAQRAAMWMLYQTFTQLLDSRGLTTWYRLRRRAMQIIRAGAGPKKYDGVVIDEAQDLDPTVLRLLVALCGAPNRLFVAADANQSIYGSSFRWSDVHEDLKVQGRTSILRTNHRSTRQIGEAAHAYLRNGALDEDENSRSYSQEGPEPAVREVRNGDEETQLVAEFLREATRYWRLGIDSCAVLVPSEEVGREIAYRLSEMGPAAEFMDGKHLDLKKRCVKVITLHSAKGLEFPIVAIAGFVRDPRFGQRGVTEEEQEEHLLKERRTLYVGMTRAMRALFVAVPAGTANPLLSGFDPGRWNVEAAEPQGTGR